VFAKVGESMAQLSLKPRKSQKGMLLIEVMVAMLLFVVGVLGLVQAMSVSQSAQSDAQYRADAAKHATAIVQQIWLTAPRGLTSATFSVSLADFQHQTTDDSDCAFSGAASANAAVTRWVSDVRTGVNRLPDSLASMQQIKVNTVGGLNQVTVILCWKGPNDTAPRKHIYSAYVNENY
jgi:type IV pilus assembly protein PilV